jgi:palmitoyltransferase
MPLLRPGEPNKRGNIITARIVPALLLGIIGYSSYVVTKHVCIDYLLGPARSSSLFHRRQPGAAAAILSIFYLLLSMMVICYARLLWTITVHPGLVPRGPQYHVEKERKRRTDAGQKEARAESDSSTEGYTPRHHRRRHDDYPAEDFWHKDVFTCNWDGRPSFCSACHNYKPDRAHHCRELGRCVLKMDHFCPWVGGIVSETSFKFFIQFTFWAALFCLDTLVVVAYYFAQRRRHSNFINVHWILVLAFASLFFLFSAGMCGSSLQFALLNSSTIENLSRKTKVWYLAVRLPRPFLETYRAAGRDDLRLITYPRPPSEQWEMLGKPPTAATPVEPASDAHEPTLPPAILLHDPRKQTDFPPHPAVALQSTSSPARQSAQTRAPTMPELRTFAILETEPGANPFDVGAYDNFRQVMGHHLWDWLFPLRLSPQVDHTDPTCMYKVGPLVARLKRKAGIAADVDHDDDHSSDHLPTEKESTGPSRHKKRRRRRHSSTRRDPPR